ncbi:MAG TPA: hypothetical protein VGK16_06745 [Candidatus Limnocylindrales bacterium]
MEPLVIAPRQLAMDRRQVRRRPLAAGLAAVVVLLAACVPGAAPTPAASTIPETTTAEAAAAAVAARSPLFDGIGPKDPDAIGASAWWTAVPFDGTTPPSAWTVTYEVGWGDCQAGCIDRHTWTYLVERDGTVTLQQETGSPLPDDLLAARVASATGPGVGGRVTAGPVCPVETPGDPKCAPRPVAAASLAVRSGEAVVATFSTDLSGLYRIALPPGEYVLEAAPVQGFMGTPAPAPFTVTGTQLTPLDIAYDTGIR